MLSHVLELYLASTLTSAAFLALELLASRTLDQVYYIINHKSNDCLDLDYKSQRYIEVVRCCAEQSMMKAIYEIKDLSEYSANGEVLLM